MCIPLQLFPAKLVNLFNDQILAEAGSGKAVESKYRSTGIMQ